LFSKAATQRMHEHIRRLRPNSANFVNARTAWRKSPPEGKHKAHHPFEDAGIGLQRCHVVALAESSGGFQSFVLGDVDGAERLELPFALQSIAASAPDGRVRPTDDLLLRYNGGGVNWYFVRASVHRGGRRNFSAGYPRAAIAAATRMRISSASLFASRISASRAARRLANLWFVRS
jgi:hypothetical protein